MTAIFELAGMEKMIEVDNLIMEIEIPFNFAINKQLDIISNDPFKSIVFPKLIFKHFGKYQYGLPIFECIDVIKGGGSK